MVLWEVFTEEYLAVSLKLKLQIDADLRRYFFKIICVSHYLLGFASLKPKGQLEAPLIFIHQVGFYFALI
jgi:hypothetical protein